MGRGIRLSQCMIVKNEEKNIKRALTWGKDIVCEQIVVDTGSTDRTVEIAESMGAKVYHFQWIDDFSAAKNYAIEQAKGDWIAFLDADEYFSEEEAGKLLPLLKKLEKTPCDIIASSMLHLNGKGNVFMCNTHSRIFRNRKNLRYRGRIHEIIDNLEGKTRYVDATQELAIFHTGYEQNEEEARRKGSRNIALIRKELEEHPDDHAMMGYLADSCIAEGKTEEAAGWYRKAISYFPDAEMNELNIRSSWTFRKLLALLMEKGLEKEALPIYQKAALCFPKDGDFDYVMGCGYVRMGEYGHAAGYLERSLSLLEKFGCVNKSAQVLGNLLETWKTLSLCYLKTGELGQCVNRAAVVLKANPYDMSGLTTMLSAFREDEQSAQTKEGYQAASPAQVLEFLRNFYDFQSLKDKLFVLKAAMAEKYDGLKQEIRLLMTPQELESFDRAVGEEGQGK